MTTKINITQEREIEINKMLSERFEETRKTGVKWLTHEGVFGHEIEEDSENE